MFTEGNIKPKGPESPFRIMVADSNKSRYDTFFEEIEKAGLDVLHTNDREKVVSIALEFVPDVLIVNLFLGAATTLALVAEIKAALPKVHFVLVTAQMSKANMKEFVKFGISDLILDPFEPTVLIERIRYQLQDRELILPEKLSEDSTHLEECLSLLYNAMRLVSETKDIVGCLHDCLKLVQNSAKSNRVNIMSGDFETHEGLIVATSDDPTLVNKVVGLEKYPEVREVLLQGNLLYLKDISSNPLTKNIKDTVKSIKIESLMVFPIRHKGETIATMNVKLPKANETIGASQMKTLYLIALNLAPKVAGALLLKRMRSASASTA
jgi:DNA-binding response OmpR family regulator